MLLLLCERKNVKYSQLAYVIKISLNKFCGASYNKHIILCQREYDENSKTKGSFRFQIQPNMTAKPWFITSKWSVEEIRWLFRLRSGHGLCGYR